MRDDPFTGSCLLPSVYASMGSAFPACVRDHELFLERRPSVICRIMKDCTDGWTLVALLLLFALICVFATLLFGESGLSLFLVIPLAGVGSVALWYRYRVLKPGREWVASLPTSERDAMLRQANTLKHQIVDRIHQMDWLDEQQREHLSQVLTESFEKRLVHVLTSPEQGVIALFAHRDNESESLDHDVSFIEDLLRCYSNQIREKRQHDRHQRYLRQVLEATPDVPGSH